MGRSKIDESPKARPWELWGRRGTAELREVKFAAYFLSGDRKAVGFIGGDRIVSAERDAVRRANLP
jgi:hypothetical protein